MKLTPEQAAWIEDLLTTDAPQTKVHLQDKKGFCCLGRACHTLGIKPVDQSRNPLEEFLYADPTRDRGQVACMLPASAVEALGLRSNSGKIDLDKVTPEWRDEIAGHTELWQLNDQAEWSFNTIGRFIQDNPEAVFHV